jgi:hypothetical protein
MRNTEILDSRSDSTTAEDHGAISAIGVTSRLSAWDRSICALPESMGSVSARDLAHSSKRRAIFTQDSCLGVHAGREGSGSTVVDLWREVTLLASLSNPV